MNIILYLSVWIKMILLLISISKSIFISRRN
jgi:hypothetical protein